MLGQYLSDRRTRIRDREARREEFRIRNFEIQRDALLELQEVIVSLNRNIRSIIMHTAFSDVIGLDDATQWYALRDHMQKLALKVAESRALMEQAKSPGELPAKRRKELATQFEKLSVEFHEMYEESKPTVEKWDELAGAAIRIKILLARTGDRDVMERSEDLLNVLNDWSDSRNADESKERGNAMDTITERALYAIGHALRNGPLS